jgi:hypothetical protein
MTTHMHLPGEPEEVLSTNVISPKEPTALSSSKRTKPTKSDAAFSETDPKDAPNITPKTSQHQSNEAVTHSGNPKDAPSINPNSSTPYGIEAPLPLANFWPPDLIQQIIRNAIANKSPKPDDPLFPFNLSLEAVHKNYCLMKHFNHNIGKALEAQQNSPLGYGSEFRMAATLAPLLRLHPNWDCFKILLNKGSDWSLEELVEEKRKDNVKEALIFGNHKGTSTNPVLLQALVNNNLTYGFATPFPLNKIEKLKGILFAPLNIQGQNKIDKTGWIVLKNRLTRNQSYKWKSSSTSVNSQVRKKDLLPCYYGGVV